MLNYMKGMYKATPVNVTLSEEAWEASTGKLEPEKRPNTPLGLAPRVPASE